MSKCQCPAAGRCVVHDRIMTDRQHTLCQTSDAHFDNFATLAEHKRKKPVASPKRRHAGLGDTVAAITRATGIEWAVNKLSAKLGIPCGCGKRRAWLNSAVPYGRSTAR
jgi:hypothetical protein